MLILGWNVPLRMAFMCFCTLTLHILIMTCHISGHDAWVQIVTHDGSLQGRKQRAALLPVSGCQRWPFPFITWNQRRTGILPVNTSKHTEKKHTYTAAARHQHIVLSAVVAFTNSPVLQLPFKYPALTLQRSLQPALSQMLGRAANPLCNKPFLMSWTNRCIP